MTRDPDCIFCKIIAGEIPSNKVCENDMAYAFMDINPGTRGHTLVIPRAHRRTIRDMTDADLSAVIVMAKKIAVAMDIALAPAGLNLHQSNGKRAGQVVPHFHLHLLPRYANDSIQGPWCPGDGGEDYAQLAEKIRKAL